MAQKPAGGGGTRGLASNIAHLLRHALPALAIASAARHRASATPREGAQGILVTRLDGIGDFILLTPFLRRLRDLYPDAEIVLAVGLNSLPLAEKCPYADRVLGVAQSPRRSRFLSYPSYLRALAKHLASLSRLAREQLRGRTAIAIQPRWDEDFDWATLLTALSCAPVRIGFTEKTTPRKRWTNFAHDRLFTTVLPPGEALHEADRSLDIIRFLSGRPADPVDSEVVPELWWDKADDLEAARFIARLDEPLIAFGIGAAKGYTRWPHYGALLSLLKETMRFTPLLIAGPGEDELGRDVSAACPSAVIVRALPLPVVAAILSRCALFVGNNSGPIHLASAVGIAVVEVSAHPIGGDLRHENHPARFGSRARVKTVIRPSEFTGSCCGGCLESEPHCIAGISPDQVAEAVLQMLRHVEASLPVTAGSAL